MNQSTEVAGLIERLRQEQSWLGNHEDAMDDPFQESQRLLLQAADALEKLTLIEAPEPLVERVAENLNQMHSIGCDLGTVKGWVGDKGVEIGRLVRDTRAALSSITTTEAVSCSACEDKPAPGNNPCAACGRIASQPSVEREALCARHLDTLTTWLLHRFGPDSPEGREASFRQTIARTALATPEKDNK